MADNVTEILLRARGDFSDLTGKISGLRKEFQNLKLPKDITANLEKGFNRLDPILKSYQKQLDKGFKTKTDLKNFEATRHELDAIFSDITSEIQKVNGQPVQLKADLKEIDALDKRLNKLGEDLQKKLNNISIDKGNKVTQGLDKIVESAKKASTIKPMTIKAQALFDTQDFAAYNSEINKMQNKILNLSNRSGAKIDLAKALGFKGETFTKEGEAITSQIEKVDTLIKNFFNSLKVSDHAMGGLEKTNAEIVQTGEALNRVKTDSLERGGQALSDFGANAQQASQQAKGLGDSIDSAASSSVRMADELQQLKTSTQYFFSLRNMLNLFKRGVQEAVDVIKELDAAMTETAVVTDFSVGDMWKKLPEYTANANALGASVKDMYEATTLYYQQGLETDAAMGIANETMKMARIGGLEAADATDKMTAALRGFNMTLDETSAQRVNDVYSNLAAKTASDTEELGTAMQRTASIAASAGMSFEGTAAFLAQAIETTREPAENLGTAMKTIVARFTELKKNPLEISEVDGEEVDYNKVDTALKSIGVSLKDTNGQFRNLDQVFLDIAQRWDGLTQTQQRYVATQAAGSRQQSRFIAMMSNYERTVELMDYANNSAGASNEQFGKTMESLEAKLNKLKNAWNEFLMGIMNDSMTKFVVDAGTKLLDILNNITDALSFDGKSGLLKSITSLTAAFMGLKTAGKLINFGVDKVGGLLNPNTPLLGFGGSHGEKVSKTTTTIVNPIVAEIRQVVAAIKGQTTKPGNTVSGTVEQYKAAEKRIRNALGVNAEQQLFGANKATTKVKYSDITDNLKGLSNNQQRQLMSTLPGLQQAMRKGTLNLLKTNNISKEGQTVGQQITKDIIKGMNKGSISIEKGIDLLRNPQKWGEVFGNQFNEGYLKEISNVVTGKNFDSLVEEAKNKYLEKNKNASEADLAKRQADFEKYAKRKSNNKVPIDEFDHTRYDKLGDKIGSLGSTFATAGQSVQQFGVFLSSVGFEKAGAAAIKLGNTISSLGMTFNGLGTFADKFRTQWAAGIKSANIAKYGSKAMADAVASGAVEASAVATAGAATTAKGFATGFLAGIPTPLLAAGIAAAVIGAIALIHNHIEKKAKEAGEEVREQFEEGFTKADEKINSLKGYESRFNELAKGVDQFGHNISLTSEEYSEYLSISRELQQLSPSLIAGYNAEGEAIIKKGAAIQDVIDKLEEEKQAELDLFTSDTSIDKLIGEYQTSDAYKNNKEKGHTEAGDYIIDQRAFGSATSAIARIGDENLLQSINQLSGWNLDSLSNLTTTQLSWLSKHYNDVINLVEEQNGVLEDEVREGYVDAFTNAGSAINDVMTEGQPIVDAMHMWMGKEKFDAVGLGLGEEFSESFNQGVEGILLTGLSEGWESDQFKTNLKDYSNEWKNLAGPTSKYVEILKQAQDVQNEYLDEIGSSDAIDNYNQNITDSCNSLIELANNTDTATAAGRAFQQQCIEQANALRTFTTESDVSLSEALNTAVDDIAQAEGALESFNEATKTDLYTAAEGMKSIYDKAFETYTDSFGGEYEKHFESKGDRTAWEAGRAILGEEALKSIPDGKALRNRLKEWEPALREGEEGWYNFWTKITNDSALMEELKKIDGVHWDKDDFYIPEDKWAQVAETIGISEEMLTSMLNKGRQFADIDFTNWGQVRHTLETSNIGIKGTSTSETGQRKLYVKESTFEASLAEANYKPEEYEAKKQEGREKQNLEYLKAANEYNAKELKTIFKDEMGFSNLQELISGLASTEDYTKEEIQAYAEKAGYNGDFDTLYDSVVEAIDNPELYKQTSVLEKISSQIALINAADTTPEKAASDRTDFATALYGTLGKIDSAADYFAHGRNKDNSSNLSVEEYEATKKSLEAQQAWAEQQASMAEARATNASTEEESAKWQAVADQWRQDAENIGTYLTMGAEAYAKAQQENQLVQDATQKAVDLSKQQASNEEIKTAMVESAQKMADAQMTPEEIAAAINQSYGTNLGKENITVDEKTGKVDIAMDESQLEGLQSQLDNLTANIKGNITEITFNGAALASGQNNPNSAFHRYGTMARGSRKGYTISGRPTLTGEEGEELVWEPKRNQAYMVGSNGPQFANISKDAVVWNAEQTKRIKKNSKVGNVGTGARGIHRFGTMANGRFGTMAGGSGMTIPGILDINAMANIQEVTPPAEEPSIPVKADLQVEGANEGNLLSKIFGGDNSGPSVSVAANITTLNTTEQSKAVNVIGNITQLKNTTNANNIDATATVTQVTKAPQVAGEPIQVKATATTTKVENKEKAPKQSAGTQIMNVTANTASAQAKINKLVSIFNKTYTLKYTTSGPRSISVPISANFTGSWKKTIEISRGSGANGINNRGFGSLAKGTGHGTVGPNNRGGLTLTGEKGFEIAWLPSENRSMILGANGPQMLNLPKDAVVFSNKQSKKILKQKAIPAGSHAVDADVEYDSSQSRYARGGKTGSTTSKNKGGKKSKGKNKKSKDSTEKSTQKLLEKVNVWWDNFARRNEARQRMVDKASKAFEKSLKGMTGTSSNAAAVLKDYQTKLVGLMNENTVGLNQATQQLRNLDVGGNPDSQAIISYSTTTTKKTKKGKNKTTTTSKQEYADLGAYIDYNVALGTYEINQAALDTISNLEQRKAIADAANQRLNDLLSKRNNAEDAIQKAQEELEKAANTMYETFYGWEKSINEIYLLSKRLEELSAFKDFSSSLVDLESAMLRTGYRTSEQGRENILNALTKGQNMLAEQIKTASAMARAREAEFQKALSLSTYYERYSKQPDSTEAQSDYNAAKQALELYKQFDNFGAAVEAIKGFNDSEVNKEYYDKVLKVLDDIYQKEQDTIDASQEVVKFNEEIYSQIEDYNDFIIDFQNEMLEGIKQQAEDEIKKLDQLNDSLTKSFKQLLDEVKQKLDERRKQEDNAKTENDISQKQQRLAMLRADTSGGHQVEIAQLEREIAEAQQSYQRTLEDQLLDRLQQQADNAEQQRQRQIELLEAANELAITTGTTMKQIEEWLAKGDATSKNALREAYRRAKHYYDEDTSAEKRKSIDDLFEEEYSKYGAYVQALSQLDDMTEETESSVGQASQIVEDIPKTQVNTEIEQENKTDTAVEDLPVTTENNNRRDEIEYKLTLGDFTHNTIGGTGDRVLTHTGWKASYSDLYRSALEQGQKLGYDTNQVLTDLSKKMRWEELLPIASMINGIDMSRLIVTFQSSKDFQDAYNKYARNGAFGIPAYPKEILWSIDKTTGKRTQLTPFEYELDKILKRGIKPYKTGGLADYTGPAWLDGTPSKPELVLNAKDTQNFIALKDVLSRALSSTSQTNSSYGNAVYEININVDHINNDYDVDKIAKRVKENIVKDSSYRNVTQVRKFR